MKCHNCENNLYLENGMYVCKNCGYVAPVKLKMNTDVFICCTQVSPQGNPTVDSMIAHDLYFRLKEHNIDVFYSQESHSEYPEWERKAAFDMALKNARIIIITGSSKSNFENIINACRSDIESKAVLPIYSSMKESDIVRTPEMFPAINYDKPGSLDNICKDITDILNLLESREQPQSEEYRKHKKKKTAIIISVIAAFVITLGIIAYMLLIAPKLADAKDYEKAQKLTKDGKYIEAIDMYYNLGNYKDSVDLLGRIYSRYNGFYRDDERMVELDLKITNRVAKIKINEYYGNKVITTKTSANVKNNIIDFAYKDSSEISGTGTIELLEDSIKLSIKSGASNKYCISSGTMEFLLSQTADPQEITVTEEITPKLLLNWLDSGVTKSDIEDLGYSLNKVSTSYPTDDLTSVVYTADDTDISLTFMYESGYSADDSGLFSVTATANFLIPNKIGEKCLPFEKGDVVYWPGDCVFWGDESHWEAANMPDESKIRKATPITLTTKTSYEQFGTWTDLTESVLQKNIGASIGSEEFIVAAENTESYLVCVEDRNIISYYIVYKITYESEHITDIVAERNKKPEELWKDYPDLFPEFADEGDSEIFYRVRKSADDVSSQIGAFDDLDRAIALADEHKDEGYKVYDNHGNLIYTP